MQGSSKLTDHRWRPNDVQRHIMLPSLSLGVGGSWTLAVYWLSDRFDGAAGPFCLTAVLVGTAAFVLLILCICIVGSES